MHANIVGLIYEQARLRPEAAALITDQGVISYAELKRYVSILARYLRDQGVKPGQVVGIAMLHTPLHLVTILALAQVGAVSLPLHPAVPAERRLLAARRFGADCVVSGIKDFALEALNFIDLSKVSFEVGGSEDDFIYPATSDTPMRVAISSGTSGNPKGMLLTHGLVALRNQTFETDMTSLSRVLPVDLNFIVGFRPAMSALARGVSIVLPSSLAVGNMLDSMIRHRVTHVYLSPLQARDMVGLVVANNVACPELVCLRIGGGLISADLLRAAMTKLSPNVYASYGSTESGMVTYATPEMLLRHPDATGRVCECATVEIVDDDGNLLPVGTTGQMRIRSSHQVSGYYCDEARTQQHFRGEWFYPGDLGHFDAEGLLYMDGRVDEQINIGGVNINPEDIEVTLAAHPAVIDAGVFVAQKNEDYGVSAVALVLSEPSRLKEIQTYASAKLGPLAPALYFIASSLPRSETGKLKRGELADFYFSKPT